MLVCLGDYTLLIPHDIPKPSHFSQYTETQVEYTPPVFSDLFCVGCFVCVRVCMWLTVKEILYCFSSPNL